MVPIGAKSLRVDSFSDKAAKHFDIVAFFSRVFIALKLHLDGYESLDQPGPKVIKFSSIMPKSAAHEIRPAYKSQITNNCKFFLAKRS